MADKEIDDLTAGTDPKAALFHGVEGVNSRKFTGAVVGHQLRGVKVQLTSDDTAVNASAGHDVSWDAAVYDTDSFWSAGAPTRLTIPAGLGITHVDISGHIRVDSSTADSSASLLIIQKDSGSTTKEQFGLAGVEKGAATFFVNVCELGIPVADGDFFVLNYDEETDNSITIESSFNQTSMTLKVSGMEPV